MKAFALAHPVQVAQVAKVVVQLVMILAEANVLTVLPAEEFAVLAVEYAVHVAVHAIIPVKIIVVVVAVIHAVELAIVPAKITAIAVLLVVKLVGTIVIVRALILAVIHVVDLVYQNVHHVMDALVVVAAITPAALAAIRPAMQVVIRLALQVHTPDFREVMNYANVGSENE